MEDTHTDGLAEGGEGGQEGCGLGWRTVLNGNDEHQRRYGPSVDHDGRALIAVPGPEL
jgi:hypothetical protein